MSVDIITSVLAASSVSMLKEIYPVLCQNSAGNKSKDYMRHLHKQEATAGNEFLVNIPSP